ncbi:MAG TPA: sodium:solute symporter family protein [Pyrinomonadaceae bacterium]|jgi:SSS family transporter|nr:sodium:solute symporter family protein [Pyrinomonadaceae bacterium]
MPTGLQTADHIIIIGYFLLLTVIGIYFWKRMKHVRDFFTGGNAIPWWLAGVSFYLTGFSAFTFVAYSEMAYRYGFVAVTLAWSSAVGMVVGTLLLAKRWRRARILSPIEFLEARYNKQIRQVLAWAGLPLKIIDDGLKIYATGVFVSVGLGYNLRTSIIVSGGVMLLYTFMGGLWAVVVTDFIQFIILTLGVIVLFPLVFAHVDSLSFFTQGAPAGFLTPISEPFSPLYVIAFYFLIILSYNGNWSFAQKFYSVRDERAARKAGMLAVALKIVGPPLFILPAMAARSLMPELMQPPNSPQFTYAALSLKFLPAGLMGLMIAAMFSATMSTLSGDYNVMASVITEDIYRRLFDKEASQRRLIIVGRLATLLVGVLTITIGVTLIASARKGLFEVMVTVFGLFVGPMLIPMLAGLLIRRVTWRGAAAGIGTGFVSGLSLYLYKVFWLSGQPGIDANWLRYNYEAISILTNFGLTIFAMVLTTALEKVTPQERPRIDEFFTRLATPVDPEKTHAKVAGEVFSPFYIIAWITAGTGLLLLVASLVQPGGTGRVINITSGIVLGVLALGLHRLHRRFMRRESALAHAAKEALLGREAAEIRVVS